MVYKYLNFLKEMKIDAVYKEIMHYLNNLPEKEKNRFDLFRQHDIIKMYYVPIYSKAPVADTGLFNIIVDCPDKNYNYKKGEHAEYINSFFDMTMYTYDTSEYFPSTIELAKNNEAVANTAYMYYKPDTYVMNHVHEEPEIITHTLLHDIQNNGHFTIHCKGHSHTVRKKGEVFSFDGTLPHSAECINGEAYFITNALNCKLLNK